MTLRSSRLIVVALAGCLCLGAAAAGGQPPTPPGAAERQAAREAITAANAAWSKVRLTHDTAGAAAMLTSDFYVALRTHRLSREDFIRSVGAQQPGARLLRFDNPVLTVRQDSIPNEWTAIVEEKLEIERTRPDGSKVIVYSLWITRDTYRQVSATQWLIRSSEEVMQEGWAGGKPPFADW